MNLCQFQLSLLILEDRSKDYHQERRIGLILNATVHGDSNLMESWGFHIIWRYGDLKEIPIWNLNGPRLASEKLLPYWDLLEERIKDFGDLFVMVISWFLYDYFWVDFQRINSFPFSHELGNRKYWMCMYVKGRFGSIFRDHDFYGSGGISDDTDECFRLSVRVDYGYKIIWVELFGFNRCSIWLKIDFLISKWIANDNFGHLKFVIERSIVCCLCIYITPYELFLVIYYLVTFDLYIFILLFFLLLCEDNHVSRTMACEVWGPKEAGAKWGFEDFDPEV